MKFTKLLLSLLLGLVSFAQLLAQPIATTPAEYEALKTYYQTVERIQKQEYDYTLDWLSRMTEAPSVNALSTGNWGTDYHGTHKNADWIKSSAYQLQRVYVLDTGGKWTNSRLAKVERPGISFTGEPGLIDVQSHSTHCAGIIGGLDLNKPIGLAAPLAEINLLELYPVKVLNDQGSGNTPGIVAGIDWVISEKERHNDNAGYIISLSLGGSGTSSAMDAATSRAEAAGILVIAAAGNNNGPVGTPANGKDAMAIAAMQKDNTRASYSNYGPEINLAAAGSSVLSLLPNNGEGVKSGTSMATPMVAALAAIVKSIHPDLNNNQVRAILYGKTNDIMPEGWDKYTGHGVFVLDNLIDDPSEPEDPEEPEEPGEPAPPTFSSSLTYEINDKKFNFRTQSGSRVEKLQADDMIVTLTALGNTDAVFDLSEPLIKTYFNNVTMVIPDSPEWGHCETTYWTGQFFEYFTRQQNNLHQVSQLKGTDEDGRSCLQYTFDRANINSLVTQEGITVMSSLTDQGVVMAFYRNKKRGFFRRIFKR